METPLLYLTLALSALAAIAIITIAGLKGFSGWLELRRVEIETMRGGGVPAPSASNRIEIADLKERIRKLEAIAAGVDL